MEAAEPKQTPIQELKGDQMKIPQKPEKYFMKVMLPKLEAGGPVDITGSLVEWVPHRLKVIKAAMRDPGYETLQAEAKSVMSSYDGLAMQCLAERRARDGIRLMLKVKGPDGKLKQAGSHVFPVLRDGCCPKRVYLYLDILRLLLMVCKHQKADMSKVKAWHADVKTYMDVMFED